MEAPTDRLSPWRTLAIVSLAGFQTAMTLSVVFVIFVDLENTFPDAGSAQLSWGINTYSVVSASLIVLGSAVVDRIGKRRSLVIGATIFMVGSVVSAVAPTVGVLIGGRALQALGTAVQVPAAFALVVAAFPRERRGIGIGVMTLFGALAAAAGPSLGGLVVDGVGWRWAFLLGAPLGLLALAMSGSLDPSPGIVADEPFPDAIGSLLLMAGVALLLLALVQTQDWGWVSVPTIGSAVAGLALIAVVLHRSRTHPMPIIDLRLFGFPSFRSGSSAMVMFSMSFFAMQFGFVLFLTDVWKYEIREAGLLAAPVFMMVGFTGPVAGQLADRVGPRRIVVGGMTGWIVVLVFTWMALGDERSLVAWFPLIIASGISAGFVWGTIVTLSVEDLDDRHIALASGVNQTLQNVGNAFAIGIVVTLLGEAPLLSDFRAVFAVAFVTAVAAISCAALLGDRRPAPSAAALARDR